MGKRIRKGGLQTRRGFLFELTGGDISLDLANTLDNRPSGEARELISTPSDLLSWSRQVGILSRRQEEHFKKQAMRKPKEAERFRKDAIALRECLFDVFARIVDGKEIPSHVLKKWNQFFHRSMSRYELSRGKGNLVWHLRSHSMQFDSILWPIIHSAVQLLTGPKASRIRRCASNSCDWLFLDTSKRGNRRWCDMTICGNRAKAQRFYYKKKRSPLPNPSLMA